jgi:hypothetical protein
LSPGSNLEKYGVDPPFPQIGNTIEGRILQIQKRKTAIVKEAFKGKGKGAGDKHDAESLDNLKTMFGMDEEEAMSIVPTQRTQRI